MFWIKLTVIFGIIQINKKYIKEMVAFREKIRHCYFD